MERVIKDEDGQQKTGSLVFRIKRTLSKTNDDSGIKCSSPSSDEMSFEKHVEHSPRPSILVRIPKALLVRAESSIKVVRNECNSPEDSTISNKNKNFSALNDNTTLKNVETEFVNADTTENNDLNTLKDNTTLKNVETEFVNADTTENNDLNTLKDNTTIKNIETALVNNDTKNNDLKALNDDTSVKNLEIEFLKAYRENSALNALKNDVSIKNVETEPINVDAENNDSNGLKDNTTTKNVETEPINVDTENNDSTALNDNTTTKIVETEPVNDDTKNNDLKALYDDTAAKNLEIEPVNVYRENNYSNSVIEDTTIKNFKTEPANTNTKSCISKVAVKFRKKARSKFEIPIELRRRSRRIIDLRFQKECQEGETSKCNSNSYCNHSSSDVPSNVENKSDMKEPKVAGCDINQIVPDTFVKKAQKRTAVSNVPDTFVKKPKKRTAVFNVVECKKRKYTRRGRPSKSDLETNLDLKEEPDSKEEPSSITTVVECKKRKYTRRGWASKSDFERSLDLKEEPCSITTESDLMNNHDAVLQTLESPVWTLVPRSLFQCNFFKSQVLQVHPIQPQEESRLLTPVNTPPPRITLPARGISNTRIRIKYPRSILNTVSTIRPKMPVDNSSKRPTVIYFRKNNTYFRNQVATSLQSEINNRKEVHNDLLYLSNKYRMLNSTVIKNCYELAWHNISEAESMLSDLFSSSLDVTSDVKNENGYVKQGILTNNNYVSDVEPMPNHSGMTDTPPSPPSFNEDTDTLCRGAIVESLKILFDEDAVL